MSSSNILGLYRVGIRGYLEFHGADLVQDFSHVLADNGPGDLVVTLGCSFDRVPGQVVEGDHVGQDPHGLVEGAEPSGRGKGEGLSF